MEAYNPKKIESKWQEKWLEEGIYKNYEKSKKFYALDMFPYISGSGIHVGHPKGYIATDVVSRFKMLQGYSVLHPMGWDAFGLPAENYAIKNKINPSVFVKENIVRFKKQLEMFGFTYDWDREFSTTDPDYYKWTQWIFLKLFEKGLAYESDEPVNWCPSCKTVLANEDLEKGLCERCGTRVIQKKVRQWVLKMTDYADRLLYDLDTEGLDWEEQIKEQQRNWIGRSEGAEVEFRIPNSEFKIKVYTTRIDTIYGCTYCVVAPEHEIIEKLKDRIENYEEIEKYIIATQNKTELERMEMKDKSGVELKGVKVINPFNNEEIPLFVADYVLAHYGTGAVMAVPAHDERDFEFAKKYRLPIKGVIFPEGIKSGLLAGDIEKKSEQFEVESKKEIEDIWKGNKVFTEDGKLWENSATYASLTSEEAREKMITWLEGEGIGKKKVNYKMRDWVFSRQRYWGEPIPIVHCKKCGAVAVPEKELPLKLPEVKNYEPTGTGEGPLANISDWVNTTCPKCGGLGKRETNTMPQWAGSSWYYLRYIDPKNNKALIDKEKEKKWMPVDLYVGGAEHATRHLLYARFWHKFLYDIKVVSTKEPFKRLIHVGLVDGEDGRKMSKRWGNVINPDDVINEFGADSLRLYEMFMGPFSQNIAWSTDGVKGVRRFLEKANNYYELSKKSFQENSDGLVRQLLEKTIKKVTEDIDNFRFNTAISQMMIFINYVYKTSEELKKSVSPAERKMGESGDVISKMSMISKDDFEKFIIILSPFTPHFCEELWKEMGHAESIFLQKWPEYDSELIKDEKITLVVQVNGKVRDSIEADAEISEAKAKELAMQSEKIKNWVSGKEIKKVIFVKGKLINIVL